MSSFDSIFNEIKATSGGDNEDRRPFLPEISVGTFVDAQVVDVRRGTTKWGDKTFVDINVNGSAYTFVCNKYADIELANAAPDRGQTIRITRLTDQDTGKGNPMKRHKIEVVGAAAAPVAAAPVAAPIPAPSSLV